MFNVGQDIFKRGFVGVRGDGAGRGRMRTVYKWLRAAFIVFIGWTLYLGISGTDNTRRAVSDGVSLLPAPFMNFWFIHLFLAVLGLGCCAWALSSCGQRGLLFPAVLGFSPQ